MCCVSIGVAVVLASHLRRHVNVVIASAPRTVASTSIRAVAKSSPYHRDARNDVVLPSFWLCVAVVSASTSRCRRVGVTAAKQLRLG